MKEVINVNYYYASILKEEIIENTYSLADECEYSDDEWGEVFDNFDA